MALKANTITVMNQFTNSMYKPFTIIIFYNAVNTS